MNTISQQLTFIYFQQSFRESLSSPKYVDSDFAKFDRPLQLHVAFQALHEFIANNNRLPKPRNEQDAEEVWQLTQQLNEKLGVKTELDEKLIKLFAYGAAGDLSPMVAVFGGLVAQEVLKVCNSNCSVYRFAMFAHSLYISLSVANSTPSSNTCTLTPLSHCQATLYWPKNPVLQLDHVMMGKLLFSVKNFSRRLKTLENSLLAQELLAAKCWRTGLWWVWVLDQMVEFSLPIWTLLKRATWTDNSCSVALMLV